MPRQTREERAARTSATGRNWAAWLKPAMAEARMGPGELTDKANALLEPERAFDKTSVSHWLAAKYGAEPDRVIAIAQVLGRDPVPALRAASHIGIAAFVEKSRTDPAGALVQDELAHIGDDPYLHHLDRLASRGHIPREERDRRRAVYLEDKRRDTETVIPEAYAAEVERIRAERDEPNGSPDRTAL